MGNVFEILNLSHPDFKRLYWSTDKDKINEIIKRINFKYLKGAERRFRTACYYESRIYMRYDGYQFLVSRETLRKEITRRIINGENYGK